MKRIINNFLSLVLVMIFLSSCSLVKLEDGQVLPPDSTVFPISPYWKFEKAYSLNKKEEIKKDPYHENQTAVLDKDVVLIGADRIKKPSIKAQRVKTYEYFLSKYKISPSDIGIDVPKIDIYSITDTKGYSIKVLKLDENRIAIEENNILVYFKKVDSLPGINLSLLKSNSGESNQNGVLLGLRGKRITKDGVLGENTYRTIWIKYNQNKELDIYEVQNILFPRNNFYLLSVDREENIDLINETLSIKNLKDNSVIKESIGDKSKSRFTDVTFLSNDYISQMTRISENKSPGNFQFYTTKNVDKINTDAKTTLGDLFGPEGSESYSELAKNELSKEQRYEALKNNIDESSFILKRKNGSWIYEGRINDKSKPLSDEYVNFNLTLRDNFRVFRFDTLVPQWARIKVLNSEAQDAVSSPNNFFCVIKTEDTLIIHPKDENGNIISTPIAKVMLNPGEEIVMHEWAVDSFVDEWEKVVKKLGKSIVK